MAERDSRASSVKVTLHCGSVLSPLLLVIAVEDLFVKNYGQVCLGSCLLYADDLVSMAEIEEILCEKIVKWKPGMDVKGLTMNTKKTNVLWLCQDMRSGRVAIVLGDLVLLTWSMIINNSVITLHCGVASHRRDIGCNK